LYLGSFQNLSLFHFTLVVKDVVSSSTDQMPSKRKKKSVEAGEGDENGPEVEQ
jgi:hypothetical protein